MASAFDWGRGYDTGPQGGVDAWLALLVEHSRQLLAPLDQSVTLIGWSLGGLYAREFAKLFGPRVRQVITIGTPFNASADRTNVGWIFRVLNGQKPNFDPLLSARLGNAPPVPTTSIYSRSDGVVAWQTGRHARADRLVDDIEARGSHIGLGWNPAVLRTVADRLRQSPGRWQRYAEKR